MDPSLTTKDIDGAWSNSLRERLLLLNVIFFLIIIKKRPERISVKLIKLMIFMVQRSVPYKKVLLQKEIKILFNPNIKCPEIQKLNLFIHRTINSLKMVIF